MHSRHTVTGSPAMVGIFFLRQLVEVHDFVVSHGLIQEKSSTCSLVLVWLV